MGNALIDSAIYIREHGGVDLEPAVIVERLMDDVVAASGRDPVASGRARLLAELAERGVPCALVTMSYARLAETMTDELPPGTFGAVVTGDQVSDGKPHPEAYLTADAAARGRPGPLCRDRGFTDRSRLGRGRGLRRGRRAAPRADRGGPGTGVVDSLTDLDVDALDALVRR